MVLHHKMATSRMIMLRFLLFVTAANFVMFYILYSSVGFVSKSINFNRITISEKLGGVHCYWLMCNKIDIQSKKFGTITIFFQIKDLFN